eukprot:COSAG06_NODE_4855_length_3902_cov_29.228241_6_plen_191_part_00
MAFLRKKGKPFALPVDTERMLRLLSPCGWGGAGAPPPPAWQGVEGSESEETRSLFLSAFPMFVPEPVLVKHFLYANGSKRPVLLTNIARPGCAWDALGAAGAECPHWAGRADGRRWARGSAVGVEDEAERALAGCWRRRRRWGARSASELPLQHSVRPSTVFVHDVDLANSETNERAKARKDNEVSYIYK